MCFLSPIILILILFSVIDTIEYYQIPAVNRLFDKTIFKIVHDIEKEKNLRLSAHGGGVDNQGKKRLATICLSSSTHHYTIDQARNLIIYCTEKLLTEINKNEKIRAALTQFPFKSENLDIMIFFYEKNGTIKTPPFISFVSIYKEKITYVINTSPETRKTETYKTALNKVKQTSLIPDNDSFIVK